LSSAARTAALDGYVTSDEMGDKFYLSMLNGIFCWTLNFGDQILARLRSREGRDLQHGDETDFQIRLG